MDSGSPVPERIFEIVPLPDKNSPLVAESRCSAIRMLPDAVVRVRFAPRSVWNETS